jgi:hypothetical protein
MDSDFRPSRRFLILFVLLLFVVLFAIAEVAFRIEYQRYAWRPPDPTRYESYPYTNPEQHPRTYRNIARMSWDPFLGYIPTPNTSDAGYHTNAQHFRYDEDLSETKGTRELRVFVTGGSTAWGAGVSQHQTYAAVLESLLAEHPGLQGFEVRVIPAAAGAWISTQERIFTLNHLLDYEPDLLIMFTGANDIYEGYRGNRLLRNHDFMGIRRALRRSLDPPVDPGEDPAEMATEDPPVWQHYPSKVVYRIALAIHRAREKVAEPVEQPAPKSFPATRSLSETLRNVHATEDAARRRQADFFVYLQPHLAATRKTLTDWEEELLTRARTSYAGWPEYVDEAYSVYRDGLAEDAAREEYGFADADAAIADEPEAVFVDDYHLGDRGNRLIAEHLFDLIAERLVERANSR